MTYEDALKHFEPLDIKEKFIKEFESYCSPGLLEKLKKSTKINSPGNLVKNLLCNYEIGGPEWNYWREVYFYFITPEKMRIRNF